MHGLTQLSLLLLTILFPLKADSKDPERLVIAHYMTGMVPQTNQPLMRWINPELCDPKGSTATLGGLHQTTPYASLLLKNADLTTAVDFEIRAARQLGLDGFQFYYPLVEDTRMLTGRYNQIIREFIRQSETTHQGFKVSLCLCNPRSSKPASLEQKIKRWAPPIRALLDETKRSPAWLRNADGKLLFYLWVGDALADGVHGPAKTPAEIRKVGAAYQALAQATGSPTEYIYHVRRKIIDPAFTEAMLDTFPAIWGWTDSEENPAFWDDLAKQCHQRKRLYTQTVYPDYYTSKVYPKGDKHHNIVKTSDALNRKPGELERHYRVTDLSRTQVHLLKKAITRKAAIINYATWNDYPEGHHLAPEKIHNFGPAILLRHFKNQWLTGNTIPRQDTAVVFYKKYPHDTLPKFNFPLKIKSQNKNLASEDRIELVTLLAAPARVTLNGRDLGLTPAGFHTHSIPIQPGAIRVQITRSDQRIIQFTTPVAITTTPSRTNRLTHSFSNVFQQELDRLFAK